jgi:hypothetical protein
MSDDDTEGIASPVAVTFTPDDWDQPHIVTMTGVDDFVDDGDVSYDVLIGPAVSDDPHYDGVRADSLTVVNQDDDQVGVTVSAAYRETSEDGQTADFTIVLNSQPVGLVRVLLLSSDTSEGTVSPTSIFFTADDWDTPQSATVTGVDDDLADGDVQYVIETTVRSVADPMYDYLPAHDVTVVNLDDHRDDSPWQNKVHPCDINNDGWITPEDLLILITDINARGARDLPLPPAPPEMPPPFLDASGDDAMSAADLLVVIEHLNAHGSGPAEGEGWGDSVGGDSAGDPTSLGGEGEASCDLVVSKLEWFGIGKAAWWDLGAETPGVAARADFGWNGAVGVENEERSLLGRRLSAGRHTGQREQFVDVLMSQIDQIDAYFAASCLRY